jgi:dihydropteroate synthase
MGIVNVTPDSFSDGGECFEAGAAVERGLAMVQAGAGMIDVGGESTRPGAKPVGADEQIRRVVPVIKSLAGAVDVPISVDTTSSKVAEAAMEAGASVINDVSALRFDGQMGAVAAKWGAGLVLMHMQGVPGDMQFKPSYDNVLDEVKKFLAERIEFAVSQGVDRRSIVVDPGIGFGKTVEHNLLLLRGLERFRELGVPVLVGVSRKAFIGKVLGIDSPVERLWGTAGAVAWCVVAGAQIVRVHDVKEMGQVGQLVAAIKGDG